MNAKNNPPQAGDYFLQGNHPVSSSLPRPFLRGTRKAAVFTQSKNGQACFVGEIEAPVGVFEHPGQSFGQGTAVEPHR